MKYLIFENNRIKQFKVLALMFCLISKSVNNVGAESNETLHLFDEKGLEIINDEGNKGFPYRVVNNKDEIKGSRYYFYIKENGKGKVLIDFSGKK